MVSSGLAPPQPFYGASIGTAAVLPSEVARHRILGQGTGCDTALATPKPRIDCRIESSLPAVTICCCSASRGARLTSRLDEAQGRRLGYVNVSRPATPSARAVTQGPGDAYKALGYSAMATASSMNGISRILPPGITNALNLASCDPKRMTG